jgi:hypothetical protein
VQEEYDRERIGVLLSAAIERQHQYWDTLRELERALGCEIDGEIIDTCDVDSLIALAEGEDSN